MTHSRGGGGAGMKPNLDFRIYFSVSKPFSGDGDHFGGSSSSLLPLSSGQLDLGGDPVVQKVTQKNNQPTKFDHQPTSQIKQITNEKQMTNNNNEPNK